jgi:hypothetical protein
MQQAGMQRLFVRALLRVIAHQHHAAGRNIHRARAFSCHFNFPIAAGHRTHRRLLVNRAHMQFLVGGDPCDRRELQRHVTGKLRMQHQSLAVRFHDCARQAIPILQRDLIRENCRGQSQNHS